MFVRVGCTSSLLYSYHAYVREHVTFWFFILVVNSHSSDIADKLFTSFLIAYCGVFGGRGIVDVLKILRDLFRTSSFSFLEL